MSSNYSKGEILADPENNRRKIFDGMKWRQLCSFNQCDKRAQVRGLCARHSKEISRVSRLTKNQTNLFSDLSTMLTNPFDSCQYSQTICSDRAIHRCSHCFSSFCLGHSLQHRNDLKEEIRKLMNKTGQLINQAQNFDQGPTRNEIEQYGNEILQTLKEQLDKDELDGNQFCKMHNDVNNLEKQLDLLINQELMMDPFLNDLIRWLDEQPLCKVINESNACFSDDLINPQNDVAQCLEKTKSKTSSTDNTSNFTLDYREQDLIDDDIEMIANYGLQNSELIEICDFSFNKIGNKGVAYLSEALKANRVLTTLNLQANRIDNVAIHYLSQALETNFTLTNLDVSRNRIGADGMKFLSNALKKNQALKILNLEHNPIGNQGIQSLSDALRDNRILHTLILNWNDIEKVGIYYLSDALQINRSVQKLELAHNRFDAKAIENIGAFLRINTTLISLDLRSNHISENGIKYLCDALKTNTTLKVLHLERNCIRNPGAEHLSGTLRINQGLTTLDLSSNHIGKIGAQKLAQALETNQTLTTLNLADNRIHIKGLQAMSDALRRNTTLTMLNVQHNHIPEKGVQYLCSILRKTKTPIAIDVTGNSISKANQEYLYERSLKYGHALSSAS